MWSKQFPRVLEDVVLTLVKLPLVAGGGLLALVVWVVL
jgi:hypothetical protein